MKHHTLVNTFNSITIGGSVTSIEILKRKKPQPQVRNIGKVLCKEASVPVRYMNGSQLLKMASFNTYLLNVDQQVYPALHSLLYDIWDLFEGDNEDLLQRLLDDYTIQTTTNDRNYKEDQQFHLNNLGSSGSSSYLESSVFETPLAENSDARHLNGDIPEYELFGISQGHMECVKALNESYRGRYRLSYVPPLCTTSLLYWTEEELAFLKELVRLCPSAYSLVCKMPIDQSSSITKNALGSNFWKDLKEVYEKSMEMQESIATWKWYEQEEEVTEVADAFSNANNMFHTPSPRRTRSMIKPVHPNTSTLAYSSPPLPPLFAFDPTEFIFSTCTYYRVCPWYYMYMCCRVKIYFGHYFRNQPNPLPLMKRSYRYQ